MTTTDDGNDRVNTEALGAGLQAPTGTDARSVLALLLAAVAGLAACGGDGQAGASRADDAVQALVRVVNVEVEDVRSRQFVRTVRLTGVAQAMRDVVVSAEEAGVVRRIVRDQGREVRRGEAIVQLDDAILAAQVRNASAQAAMAQEVWDRRRKLYEEDEVGSEMIYLEAKYSAAQAHASLEALRERLNRTVVRAPVAGILDERLVELGAAVVPGAPVARIVQVDSIKIAAGVPERFALDVVDGTSASVEFDVLDGESFEGRITYVGATVDPENRTFSVELVLPNPGRRIKPEMIAEITVVRQEIEGAIVVPQQALVSMEEGYVVFVVEGSGEGAVAAARPVQVLAGQGNEAVVGSGLDAGERLVVVGQQGLTAGDRVRVVAGAGEGSRR